MKKQFLAKLLVLVMVLSMIPGAMLVAGATSGGNTPYPNTNPPGTNSPYDDGGPETIPDAEKIPAIEPSDETDTVIAEVIDASDIEVEDGSAKIKATVSNGVAKLKMNAKAVAGLSEAVKSGKLSLEIEDEGATKLDVSLNAKALTTLAKETGADLDIKSSVAEITIPNSVLASAAGKVGNVQITAEHSDKVISFTIQTGGKALKNVKGIKVEF